MNLSCRQKLPQLHHLISVIKHERKKKRKEKKRERENETDQGVRAWCGAFPSFEVLQIIR